MGLQLKPKEFDGPMYSPNRDMAYLYMPFLREVVYYLKTENMKPQLREFCEKNDITEEKLNTALKAITDAHHNYIALAPESGLSVCLENASFDSVDFLAELVLFYTMGLSLNAGFFHSLRDVTQRFTEPIKEIDFTEVLALCRELLDQRFYKPGDWVARDKDTENLENNEYFWKEKYELVNSILSICSKEMANLEQRLSEANKKVIAYRDEIYNLNNKVENMKRCGIVQLLVRFWNYLTFRS